MAGDFGWLETDLKKDRGRGARRRGSGAVAAKQPATEAPMLQNSTWATLDDNGRNALVSDAVAFPATSPRISAGRLHYHDLTNSICLATAASISPKIRRAVGYIEQHYHQKLTLRRVAAEIRYHPNHLCQKFREEVGTSFADYLVRTRLKHALRLLIYTDDPIKHIGYRTGFRSPQNFCKVFARWLHCSPTVFRERYRYR
jgi:AraC-like DNA-binding protein